MLRLPEAPVMLPNDDVLMVEDGLPKFVWLNKPNVSKRNWNLRRSLIGKFLNTEKFTAWELGPWSRLRPALPYAKLVGLMGYRSATVKAVASMHPTRCPRPQLSLAACTRCGR